MGDLERALTSRVNSREQLSRVVSGCWDWIKMTKRTRLLITAPLLSAVLAACKSPATATGRSAEPTRKIATLSEQKMCADQAEKSFQDSADAKNSTYTNHYDPTVGVCYIEVTTRDQVGRSFSYGLMVYDAFEGRIYARYLDSSGFGSSTIQECSVTPRGQPEIQCRAREEFNGLVLRHFGTTPD
jgi:hypothetical protein